MVYEQLLKHGKHLTAFCSAFGVLYAALWGIGQAPITNSMAAEIAAKEVLKYRVEQKKTLDKVEKNSKAITRIEESTRRTERLQEQILQQLLRNNKQ